MFIRQQSSTNCATAGQQVTCTFSYTGAAQTWTVPAGVSQATFDVLGAQGGGGYGDGGKGGEAQATLMLQPGATYQITVGGAGSAGSPGGFGGVGPGGTGGFNGGGGGESITYSASGAQAITSTTVQGSTATITIPAEGSTADEQQGFVTGAASTSGSLQAARAGNGSGRVCTLTYQGSDAAGNTATCPTTVTVPHDQGH